MPTKTLATTVVKDDRTATSIVAGGNSPAVTMDLSAILPEAKRVPRIFIGADEKTGLPFYAWDSENESRAYQATRSFTALITGVRTVVQNPDDDVKRSVKLIVDMALDANGMEISLSTGAKTYSALSLVASLSGLTNEQLARPVGLSGKVGQRGVVFMSVYADGKPIRNIDAEELLRESRKDDKQVEALEGFIAEINARIKAGVVPAIAGASDEEEGNF